MIAKDREQRPASPCVSICSLDESDRCLGCGRTLAQIARWPRMTAAEQWDVIDALRAAGPAVRVWEDEEDGLRVAGARSASWDTAFALQALTAAANKPTRTAQESNVDVNSRIEDQLKAHDILLYMKGTPDFPQCGFSGQTVAALNAIGRPYAYVNIFEDPEIREGLKTYSNWPTFPQLYVKGELIGGCDIVVEMYQSGELKTLLEEASPAG